MKPLRLLDALAAIAFTATGSFAQNDPYYDWIVSHWGQQIVSNEANRHTVWGEHVDPDGDQIPNLLEYATGTNPKVPNPVTDAYVFHLPTEGIDSARFPEIKAWIRTTDPDLRVIAQTSTDHQIWTPSGTVDFSKPQPANPAVNEIPSAEIKPGFIRFRYIDKDSMQGRGRAFMRLKVVRKNEVVTGAAIDPFFFTGGQTFQTGAIARSNAIAIGGFSGAVTVTIPSGVRFFLNDVLQTGPTVSVRPGDVVHLEANTPTTAGWLRQYTLNIGGVSSTWSFRSGALASVPDHGGTDSGYTPVETGVSDTGAAQVNIPIVVSPGTAGMQPKLSIGYSSQGGNGPLGVGFSLNGLSAISRVGRTVAQDGVRGSVNLDANDRFALDGQRLIAINGQDGANGTEYRLEFDPSSRIRSYNTQGSGPQRWVVETKGGLIIDLGLNSNSRVTAGGDLSVLTWCVTRITDTAGNTINFTYDNSGRQRGEPLLTQVSYTANTNAGLSANQSVILTYEDRPDPRTSYFSGLTIQSLKRLARIESRHGTSLVRRYDMVYRLSQLSLSSLLTQVREVAPDDAVRTTDIDWMDGPLPAFTSVRRDYPPHSSQWHYLYTEVGDFNGDGKSDMFSQGDDGLLTVFLRRDNEADFDIVRHTPANGFNRGLMWLGDFNGDGLTDVLTRPSGSTRIVTYFSGGNGQFTSSVFDQPVAWDTGQITLGDFNGDARTDFVTGIGTSQFRTFLSNGDGTYTSVSENVSWGWNGSTLLTGDFDGDGLTDFLSHNGPTNNQFYWTVMESDGDGTFTERRSHYPTSFGNGHGGVPPVAGDFNGDGITDVAGVSGQTITVFLLDGAGGVTPVVNNVGISGFGWRGDAVGAFNSDRMTDMMSWLGGGTQIVRFIAKGNGILEPQIENNAVPWDPNNTVWVGDFDGDGKADVISSYFQFTHFTSSSVAEDLVTRVTNGHGGQTSFAYKPMTDDSVYTRGTGMVYPCVDFQASMYVVSSMTARNGIDGDAFAGGSTPIRTNTVNYRYVGAWSCLDGRGFMGFQWVESTDPTSGIVTHTQFETDPLKAGRVKATRQDLITPPPGGSGLIGYSTTSWRVYPDNTHPSGRTTYFVGEATNFTNNYEVNGPGTTPVKTVVRFGPDDGGIEYDARGNVLVMTTDTSGGGESFQETVTSTYADVETSSKWHLGRLKTSKVIKFGPNPEGGGFASVERNSEFTYHPTTGLLTQEVIEPTGGPLRQQKDYTHDGFGNILTSTLTTQGEAPRTTTTTYTADGRFVMSTTNSVGHTETKTHDPALGNVLTQTGPNGLTTSWQYDAIGRPIRESRPDGTVTRSFYRLVTGSTVGAPPRAVHYVRAQSTGSAPKTVWYDLLDREIRTDGIGFDGRTVSSHQVYNTRGEVTHASQPYFAGEAPLYSTTQYDAIGRPTLTNDPGNRVTRTTYDGLTTTVERNYDPANPGLFQKAVTVVNVMGWTVSSSQFLGSAAKTITKRYDPYGNLRFVVDPAGNTTEIRYDVRGNKVWMSEPNSGVTSYTHNGFGELKTQTNSSNQTTSLTYDKLGRVLSRSEPEGVTEYTYDTAPMGKGQLARELMAGFERRHFYDHYGRPASSVEYHGSRGFAVSRGYDPAGRPDALTYPTGFSTRHVYTANGHLSAVRNGSDAGLVYWEALSVNSRGQVESETLGNGVVTTRGFDPATGLIETIQSGISDNGVGRDLQDLSYSFDLLGNLRERHDTRFSTPFSEIFTYDTLNRLKTVDTTGGVAVIAGYNDIGNLTSRSDVGSFAYSSARPHALTSVGGGNFNKVCEYDAKGNRTRDGGTILAYSSFNKPVTIAKDDDTLTFAYGPDRNLFRQTIVADALAAPTVRDYIGGLYEREVTSTGDVRHTHYIAGGNGVVAIHTDERSNFGQQSQRTRYVHKDHLGSVDVISDSAGQEAERQSYDAWGRRRTVTHSGGNWTVTYPTNPGSNETRRGFTGHEMLDLVGLVHMGGRVYDPISARFLSPDPFVQAPDNLQNLNRYSYVLNNPLSYTDPSGFFFKSIGKFFKKHWKTIAAVGVGVLTGGLGAWAAIGFQGTFAAALGTAVSGASFAAAVGAGAGFGFGSSFSGTLLAGGSIGDALRSGLKSAVISGAQAAATFGVADAFGLHGLNTESANFAEKLAVKVAAHGAIGGGFSELQGGQFKHGFLSGSFAGGASPFISGAGLSGAGQVAAAALVGGTSAAMGGGKFANGAVTGAFVYIFNQGIKASENGHLNLFSSNGKDETYQRALSKAIPPSDAFWVTGHGTQDGNSVVQYVGSEKVYLSPNALAGLIQAHPGYQDGQRVWLDVCHVGNGTFSADLSRALGGVDVFAAPNVVFYHPAGPIWAAASRNNSREIIRYRKFNSSD